MAWGLAKGLYLRLSVLGLIARRDSVKLKGMNALGITAPSISQDEMQSRREAHESSRHSLRLEGLDGFLTPEDDAQAEAWIRGEITLEKAIENTLESIRASSRP